MNDSSLRNPRLAGGGGLIRNSRGLWVRCFSRAISITSSVQAKLRTLKDGLVNGYRFGHIILKKLR
jgi:hypothetical protein